MQRQHGNSTLYFEMLSTTSEKYFLPYINTFKPITSSLRVLEIGCGEGGNLLPFAERGCETFGVDIASERVHDGERFFSTHHVKGTFIASDIFLLTEFEKTFDIIICHDVLEHLDHKSVFLTNVQRYLKPDGIVFMSFPAWYMPFGGHQQLSRSKIVSHLPFIHLLPNCLYKLILRLGGADSGFIDGQLSIKRTRVSIETFETLVRQTTFSIVDRQLWFINPHYEVKFGLKPRKLCPIIGTIPYLRDFFTTSCFYILRDGGTPSM